MQIIQTKKDALVSVAIITYNHEEFIENAIESALSQSYTNIEIVISDDYSTDETVSIIKQYVQKYPNKITLLTADKNQGVTENWFKCVHACTGKYIIGLAGDDELLQGIIHKQIKVMEKDSRIAICYADAVVFDVAKDKALYYLSEKVPAKSGNLEVALKDSIYYSPSTMFKKKLLPKTNIFKGLRHGTDLAFYKEIMINAGPDGRIQYLPEVLYKYQKHESNITVSQGQYRIDHIEAIKVLQKKYPEYANDLRPAIYDFCCVAFIKNLVKFNFSSCAYFLINGLKASNYNPYKFLRASIWGVKFHLKFFFK